MLPAPLIAPVLNVMLAVPSASRLAALLRVTLPVKVPVPEVILLPRVVVPVPELATVTVRATVTPLVPINRALLLAPVLASLRVTVEAALPRVPAAPLGALAFNCSVP